MELIVVILVVSIYTGAFAAPLALYALARRTGHGAVWQAGIILCAAVIWIAIILGFLREVLNLHFLAALTEPAGVMAVIAFAILALIGLALALKSWPEVKAESQQVSGQPMPTRRLAADID